MVNNTTRLLGLEDLAVVDVLSADEGADGPIVHLVTADEQARACPECGVSAVRIKEWVTTRPRDLPAAGRRCDLRWRKRRWYCDEQTCPRGTFAEHVAQVPARARLTRRLRQAAGTAVADGGRTIVQSARDHGVSWPVVCAAFTAHAARGLPDQPAPSRCWGSMRSAVADPAGRGTIPPAAGRPSWIDGTSASSISPAGKGCSASSKAAPAPPSPAGSATAARPGVMAWRSSRSTCAPSSNPPSAPRYLKPGSWSIIFTWSSWPIRPSLRSAAASPFRSGAGVGARAAANGNCVTG